MKLKLDKTYLLVLLFCLGLNFFPIAMPTAYHIDEIKSPLFKSFPYQLGDWKGKDTEVDERTYEILETRNVLSRAYEDSEGLRIHLLLVGSYKDRRVAHPPEVCYLSSNYVIMNETQKTLQADGKKFDVKSFLARNERFPDQQEDVIYVYKVGNELTTNYYSQQLKFAMDRLSKKSSDVLLIRMAVPAGANGMIPENWEPKLQALLNLVLKEVFAASKVSS